MLSAFDLTIMAKCMHCEYPDGLLITFKRLSVECWTLLTSMVANLATSQKGSKVYVLRDHNKDNLEINIPVHFLLVGHIVGADGGVISTSRETGGTHRHVKVS